MASNYPHKQTIIIAAVCLIAIAGVAVYTQRQKTDASEALNIVSPVQQDVQGDTKLASTTNWQKDFFTLSTSTKKLSTANQDTSSTTLTDQISKDFFARYMMLRQAGQTGDSSSVKSAMDQTIANAATAAPKPKTYFSNDIIISADNSPTAIHTYANTAASLLLTYVSKLDPTAIASDALDTSNMDELKDIDPIIAGYQKTIAELLKTPVPSDLQGRHINMINGLSVLLYVSEGLRHIKEDSMQSMIALGLYTTGQDSLRSALLEIRDYISVRKILIAPTEPGYLYFQIN